MATTASRTLRRRTVDVRAHARDRRRPGPTISPATAVIEAGDRPRASGPPVSSAALASFASLAGVADYADFAGANPPRQNLRCRPRRPSTAAVCAAFYRRRSRCRQRPRGVVGGRFRRRRDFVDRVVGLFYLRHSCRTRSVSAVVRGQSRARRNALTSKGLVSVPTALRRVDAEEPGEGWLANGFRSGRVRILLRLVVPRLRDVRVAASGPEPHHGRPSPEPCGASAAIHSGSAGSVVVDVERQRA